MALTEDQILKALSDKIQKNHERKLAQRLAEVRARGKAEKADAPAHRGHDRRDATVRAAADLDRQAAQLRAAADRLRQEAEAQGVPRRTKR